MHIYWCRGQKRRYFYIKQYPQGANIKNRIDNSDKKNECVLSTILFPERLSCDVILNAQKAEASWKLSLNVVLNGVSGFLSREQVGVCFISHHVC